MATVESISSQNSHGPFWANPRVRAIAYQIGLFLLVTALVGYIAHNTAVNLQKRGIASGFGFLDQTAGFDILMTLIPYKIGDTHFRVFIIGILNTLFVSAIGIVLATLLGFVVGICRLSRNWIIRNMAYLYVESIRNVPLLLQMFFWYKGVFLLLPLVRDAIPLGAGIFISQRGLYMPSPIPEKGFSAIPIAFGIAIVLTFAIHRWARKRQEKTGQPFPSLWMGLTLIIGAPLLAALVTGLPFHWEFPVLQGFNFQGGIVILPEMAALEVALVTYTAAFISEIVRSGIQAISHGQTEAAYALGLNPNPTLRLVIIPQALRVIVPPLTSQYLNLTKNSSLAVAIGFPDLFQVFAGTSLNITGQAVEIMFMTMMVYLAISMVIALFMNWYNRRIALVER
ncbi:MAG: amino acid ABC transporter permease [Alphaproteobacteria bacterium]